ncbi:FAD-dependent oxidoreductase [Streptosporangium sp. CA-115845]|uniref:oxidoreductase n=1 Tax=Streptosporangium sp. CA-115845 TaxID=3240071 RepID=UPI003D902D3C
MRRGARGSSNTPCPEASVSQLSLLFTPITIGGVAVRNRAAITAHGASEMFRNPRLAPEPYIEYLRRRAAGGVGLIIAQALYVNPLDDYPAEFADRHARLAEAVKAEGATLLLQLVHLGATFRSDADVRRPPLWGFGTTLTDRGEISHAMTGEQIEMMIAGYGRIAAMAVRAGFDGCEIHGAHGYLGQQSLSPWLNRRDDEWGLDRTLFLRRVIEVVRGELGPDRILGYRSATDDLRSPEDEGLGAVGSIAAVQAMLATGEIDLVNTTVGHGGKSYAQAIPSYRHTEGVNMPRTRRLRDAIGAAVPVIGVGRISSIAVAEALLRAGDCDLVAMTRAHIADPDIVSKARRGVAHRIRPCVGALVCKSRKLDGFSEITCLHNPEALREHEFVVRPAEHSRRVVVVGAGPAGLKCAEVAARRGHEVRIFDAARRAGGALRWVERTAAADLAGSVDHLAAELEILGVKPELGVTVDAGLLEELRPDHVVLATGAARAPGEPFPGAETTRVLSGVQALDALDGDGDDVLVFDAIGANEGALVAEALAARSRRVTFVTPYETVTPYSGASHRMEVPDVLRRRMSQIVTQGLLGFADGRVVTVVRPEGETIAEIEVGAVVAIVPPEPRLELLETIRATGVSHSIVGDAQAPRTATEAFREGALAALVI